MCITFFSDHLLSTSAEKKYAVILAEWFENEFNKWHICSRMCIHMDHHHITNSHLLNQMKQQQTCQIDQSHEYSYAFVNMHI